MTVVWCLVDSLTHRWAFTESPQAPTNGHNLLFGVLLKLWGKGKFWAKLVSMIICLFYFPQHDGACCVCSQQWAGVCTTVDWNKRDKAIKVLFVPFVTTGWGLKQSMFYQCQRCDETWLTQEANGIKAPICQACSRPDRSKRKTPCIHHMRTLGINLRWWCNLDNAFCFLPSSLSCFFVFFLKTNQVENEMC